MASLMKDSLAAPIFRHFVMTIGPSLSIFERHFTNPEAILAGTAIPVPQQALWTYILPTVALTNQALLYAILALASLHIGTMNLTTIQSSLKYYRLALERLAESIQIIKERIDLGTIAAALLLGYFEAMTAEYGKWTNHLLGVKCLFLELDIKEMANQLKWSRYQSNVDGPDAVIVSQLMGQYISYDESSHGIDNNIEPVRAPIAENDVQVRESYCDLFWSFCKQDVYQSIISGNQLLYAVYFG